MKRAKSLTGEAEQERNEAVMKHADHIMDSLINAYEHLDNLEQQLIIADIISTVFFAYFTQLIKLDESRKQFMQRTQEFLIEGFAHYDKKVQEDE